MLNIDYSKLNIFGVRHLSPNGSYHLYNYLEEIKPKIILIEGAKDATEYIKHFSSKKIKLPVALLSYTIEYPMHTMLYPYAKYSPEYIAIKWSLENKKISRFIDLPSNNMLLLHKEKSKINLDDENATNYNDFLSKLYKNISKKFGEEDYETSWERNFEHNQNKNFYLNGVSLQSTLSREITIGLEEKFAVDDFSYNQIRESFMKKEIIKAFEEGYNYNDIVIVCGAYHVAGLKSELKPITDDEINKLPSKKTKIALMPYSYYRLSSLSGYGAGNIAPKYFEMMFDCLMNNNINDLPSIYLSKIGRITRENGNIASTASVIESIRLANALSSIHNGNLPTLKDLHDASITCIGEGEFSSVADAITRTDIGTDIGNVPEGVGLTPVQEDMIKQIEILKLESYKSNIKKELKLDLRENRRVSNKDIAFLDLNRSILFNRLNVLDINFAEKQNKEQQKASFTEIWNIVWTPEIEIQIVETNLKGETIEIAASYQIKELLQKSKNIQEVSVLIKTICNCNLMNALDDALNVLNKMATETTDFINTAFSAFEINTIINFSNLRNIDSNNMIPLLKQLFLKASLVLNQCAICDNNTAKNVIEAINSLNIIAEEQFEVVDSEIFIKSLKKLSSDDSKNPILSGYAFSLLLEKNFANEEDCSEEIARRLSNGTPADIGAGWFEGLSKRNRHGLLSRIYLWKELDKYIENLDEEEFFRSVVFLRRAFGEFDSREKNGVTDLLAEFWGLNQLDASEELLEELSEDEESKLSELNNFDFGDLL